MAFDKFISVAFTRVPNTQQEPSALVKGDKPYFARYVLSPGYYSDNI